MPKPKYPSLKQSPLAKRFRGMIPIVVDIETGGLEPKTDAILEIAAKSIRMNDDKTLEPDSLWAEHILPFEGAGLDPKALEINKIDPYHPFRFALTEPEGFNKLFTFVNDLLKQHGSRRAILVGHNAWFDLAFLNAGIARCDLVKSSPFHRFTTFDTATLGALAYGQTVLARAARAARIKFDTNEAHSAIYDTEKTAELFCTIVNAWPRKY